MHRNRLLDCNGKIKYFSIPFVKKDYLQKKFSELEVNNNVDWRTRNLNFIKENYKKTLYFSEGWPFVVMFFNKKFSFVYEYSIQSIIDIKNLLEIPTNLILQSSLNLPLKDSHKSNLIVEICRELNATNYYSGSGGSLDYLDTKLLKNNNINVAFIKTDLIPYNQNNSLEFVPGLSILDLLFNVGFEGAKFFFLQVSMNNFSLFNKNE